MDASFSSASSSPEHIEDDNDNRNYCLLPAFSTAPSLRSEIPERLLQDDQSTLSSSSNERNTSIRRSFLQEDVDSPREERPLQQDPSWQGQLNLPSQQDTEDHPEHMLETSTALFQEWNLAEAGQDVRKPSLKPYSWKEKLGTFATVGLIAGFILLCAAVGTLTFLWFGSTAIPAWKDITARNWLSKAISVCIGVIQQVMMLQLGIVTATLASLALESRDIVIGDVASVSAMRATAPSIGAFTMAWQYLSGGSYRGARHSHNILPILSAALIWCLCQFFLLIILTDVSLRSTPGLASPASLRYSLHYNETDTPGAGKEIYTLFQDPAVGGWNRKISKYATFAEYSEPPYVADGVSDTGVTLRAFLPFGTAQDREKLESYKGKSTVLDARVTCQVPQFRNVTLNSMSELKLSGSLMATRNTPRLANLLSPNENEWSELDCDVTSDSDYFGAKAPQWVLSVCQLWKSVEYQWNASFGGLVSEFSNQTGEPGFHGPAYLFLNQTFGASDRLGGYWNDSLDFMVAEASRERNEWLDLIFANGSFVLSASICYAAFDIAEVDVRISSHSNRTESRLEPVFDQATSTYTFRELRNAMGQDRSLPVDRQSVLELAKGTWQVPPDAVRLTSDVRRTSDLAFTKSCPTQDLGTVDSFMTGLLYQTEPSPFPLEYNAYVIPEDMHVLLIQEILRTNGSIAFALQTMITLLSSMTYYDQMGQFDKWTQAELTFFETAPVPVGYVGFVVVMVTVTAHCILVVYCVSLFIRKTTLSRLGASWSAVAQVATGDVMEYLGHSTLASDNDVQARLKADGKESLKVCLEEVDGQVAVSIIGKDEEK